MDGWRDLCLCTLPRITAHSTSTHSLTNSSTDIRWSLDLRWQDATLPAGFWGIKDSILLRKAADPAYTPDWEGTCTFVFLSRVLCCAHAVCLL